MVPAVKKKSGKMWLGVLKTGSSRTESPEFRTYLGRDPIAATTGTTHNKDRQEDLLKPGRKEWKDQNCLVSMFIYVMFGQKDRHVCVQQIATYL